MLRLASAIRFLRQTFRVAHILWGLHGLPYVLLKHRQSSPLYALWMASPRLADRALVASSQIESAARRA